MHTVLLYAPVKATLGLDGGFSKGSLKAEIIFPQKKGNMSLLWRDTVASSSVRTHTHSTRWFCMTSHLWSVQAWKALCDFLVGPCLAWKGHVCSESLRLSSFQRPQWRKRLTATVRVSNTVQMRRFHYCLSSSGRPFKFTRQTKTLNMMIRLKPPRCRTSFRATKQRLRLKEVKR